MSADNLICRFKRDLLPASYILIALAPIIFVAASIRGLTRFAKVGDWHFLLVAIAFGVPAYWYVSDLARIRRSSILVDSKNGTVTFCGFRFWSLSPVSVPGRERIQEVIRFEQIVAKERFPSGKSGISGIVVRTTIGRVRIWDTIENYGALDSIIDEIVALNDKRDETKNHG